MPLNIDWQQILLHLLNFVILFTGLWFLLYKPVRSFMQKRKEHYEKMDADAEKKHAEAEEKRAVYEEKLAHAEDEIAEKRRLAEKETAEYDERKRRETDELAKNIVADARQDAARIKAQATKEARAEIASIVTDAVEKIVLEDTASEAFDQFLDAVGAQPEPASEKPASEAFDDFLNAADAQAEKKDE